MQVGLVEKVLNGQALGRVSHRDPEPLRRAEQEPRHVHRVSRGRLRRRALARLVVRPGERLIPRPS